MTREKPDPADTLKTRPTLLSKVRRGDEVGWSRFYELYIIFVNDVPKLADIDLLAGHDAALTSYIPREYAAPEGSHSTQADIFSLGKTLYEMCTGLPVKAFPCLPPDIRHWEDHQALLKINKIIARACVRDRHKRYRSAEHLLNDLSSVCQCPITWSNRTS